MTSKSLLCRSSRGTLPLPAREPFERNRAAQRQCQAPPTLGRGVAGRRGASRDVRGAVIGGPMLRDAPRRPCDTANWLASAAKADLGAPLADLRRRRRPTRNKEGGGTAKGMKGGGILAREKTRSNHYGFQGDREQFLFQFLNEERGYSFPRNSGTILSQKDSLKFTDVS